MTVTLIDSATFSSTMAVPDEGTNHTTALCQTGPHQYHANNSYAIKSNLEILQTPAEVKTGSGSFGVTTDTLLPGNISTSAKADIPSSYFETGDVLVIYANAYLYTIVNGYHYAWLYNATASADMTTATQCLPPYWGGNDLHSTSFVAVYDVTAFDAANGINIRFKNGSGSAGNLLVKRPYSFFIQRIR